MKRFVMFCVITAVFLAGCEPWPTFTVKTDRDLCVKPVTLHLIGITDAEYRGFWETVSMTDYWKTEPPQEIGDRQNQLRKRNLFFEYKFGPQAECSFILSEKNPFLKTILSDLKNRKINYILVLVDMPDWSPDKPGDADARRYCLNPRDVQNVVEGPLFSKKRPKHILINIDNNNIFPTLEY